MAIENKMITGVLQGLVSTNALELGIDIGKIDTTVLVGYPGTRASFWQQTGRAGRSGRESTNYLILDNLPFDQYIGINPDWLFANSCENAVIDKNNLLIQLAHIRAAAAEIPLTLNDISLFPDLGETIPVLMYKKLQFHNHQNLGFEQLDKPLAKDYDTESTWLKMPDNVVNVYRRLLQQSQNGQLIRNNYFEGLCYALKSVAMMATMTEREDIGVAMSNNAIEIGENFGGTVYLFISERGRTG